MSVKSKNQDSPVSAEGHERSANSTSPNGDPPEQVANPDRRNFFKRAFLSASSVAGATVAGAVGEEKAFGQEHDEFPVPLADDYKPMDQRNIIFAMCMSDKLNEKHPERSQKFNGFSFRETFKRFGTKPPQDKPGYTQKDKALSFAGWALSHAAAPLHEEAQPNSGVFGWEQTHLAPMKYKFESEREASLAVKSAARIFGAARCGITRRDKRWDYDPLYDYHEEREVSWDEFPFEPKSVIVMAVEMDYVAMATAPAWIESGTAGDGYSQMVKVATQITMFLRAMGYQAVGAGNDLAPSVPYAIAAGLGEGARNGTCILPQLGPRVRLCKVYTELDFFEYDKPRTFGVMNFCAHCKRCADACPSEAISFEDQPSFEPTYSNDPDETWCNHHGIRKWHSDSRKCYKFWTENDGDCGSCITSCPYNKPDFWHHRLIDWSNQIVPGPMHSLMREMDIIFGYGNTHDEEAPAKFWESGKDMAG